MNCEQTSALFLQGSLDITFGKAQSDLNTVDKGDFMPNNISVGKLDLFVGMQPYHHINCTFDFRKRNDILGYRKSCSSQFEAFIILQAFFDSSRLKNVPSSRSFLPLVWKVGCWMSCFVRVVESVKSVL